MRSNEEIIDLIDSIRKEKGLSLSELARRVGMAKSALSRYFNKTREFPLNKVEIFANVLDISSEYILGFDSRNSTTLETIYNQLDQKRQQKVYSFAEQQLKEQNKIVDYPTKYSVNIYGKMTAGYGSINFDKEHPIKTVTLDYAPPGYDIAFEVSGDSMHPAFQDGEVIFVKETQNIHDGMLAAVEINDEAFIKKLYIEENRIRLVSLNCEKDKNGNRLYPDFYADEKDNIHMIGRVLT
ncbi:XRE family transcriptional regulator [Enterococcus mundtii]|uniref:XRE family transcriptional regulator n=1 Tax=Enterococcus mundtii TaxID=53346 RepID=UPI00336A8160